MLMICAENYPVSPKKEILKKAWRGREERREKDGKFFYYSYLGLFRVPMLGSLIM